MGLSDRCLMTWEGSKSRWRKMHRGRMYFISCHKLGVPATREASYQAANAWWRKKLIELEAQVPTRPSYGGVLDRLEFRRDWCRRHDRQEEAAVWEGRIKDLLEHPDVDGFEPASHLLTPDVPERIASIEAFGGKAPADMDSLGIEYTLGDGRVWYEREMAEARNRVPEDESIGGFSRRYIEQYDLRRLAGDLSAGEYALVVRRVNGFVDWIGPGNSPDIITATRWEDYWKHLLKRVSSEPKFSSPYAKKFWSHARRFVQWMVAMGTMMPPANLSKVYKFPDTTKPIATFTVSEARKLVEAAPGQLKLHLMLMINRGFTQSDISTLRHDEIDWQRGIISRQRSKTRRRHGDSVPTVSWVLWPETFVLLKRYRSDHPTLALTTANGKPWVEEDIRNGKQYSRDAIQSNFRHIQQRTGIKKPLKLFRKTSSSLLDKSTEFGRYAQYFLGHASDTVAGRHYVVPSQEQFDRAVWWLRQQYGYVD